MRVKGRERAEHPTTEEELEKQIDKAFPKSDHIKESRLITMLKPLLDEVTEDDLRKYQFEGGARDKIQFNQYPAINNANRQIFDTSGEFKTMPQLNAACHYYGSIFLQYFFIVRRNIPLSRFTIKFLEREHIRNFRGQLTKALEEMKESLDFRNAGTISEEDFEKDRMDIVDWFEPEQQEIVIKFLDEKLFGEESKSINRLYQQKHRTLKLIRSGLRDVNAADNT